MSILTNCHNLARHWQVNIKFIKIIEGEPATIKRNPENRRILRPKNYSQKGYGLQRLEEFAAF